MPATTSDASLTSTTAISGAVVALSLGGFSSAASLRVTDALLPRLANEFQMPLSIVSWTITCFTLGYAACTLLFGPLGDRFGKYRVVAYTCAACCFASLLCAAAPNLWFLLAARTILGGVVGAIIPLAMAWIGDVVPYERRQPVLARFLIGQILGVSSGQLLGGLSADYLGRRVPFVLLAGFFAFSAVWLFAMRRKLPANALTTHHSEAHVLRHAWHEFLAVMAQPWAQAVVWTTLLEGATVFGAFAFFATHLHRELNVALTTAGSIGMLFGLGGFSFAAASRHLITRLGEIGLVRYGAVLVAIAFCVIAFAPSVALAAAACFTMGLGFYMLHNTLQINATQMAPDRRGAAVSAFALFYFVGQSFGVAIAGWFVSRAGTRDVIFAAAVGVLVVAFNFARLKRKQLLALNAM